MKRSKRVNATKRIRRIIIIVAALVSAIIVCSLGSVLYPNRGVRAVGIPIIVKDLPERGLALTPPSDPAFDQRVASAAGVEADDTTDAFTPISVLLSNAGHQDIIGYSLRWELVRADGRTSIHWSGGVNGSALMGQSSAQGSQLSISRSSAIPAGRGTLVSPIFSPGQGMGVVSGVAKDRMPQLVQAIREGNHSLAAKVISAELAECVSITVSIEGAFFDDGTFVGPNSDLFERYKASMDAERDLYQEIQFALSHGKTSEEALKDVEEWASSPDAVPAATPTDHYNSRKKTVAQHLIRMSDSRGPEAAIRMALEPLSRQWLVLTRK
jgi:hypothetical protein